MSSVLSEDSKIHLVTLEKAHLQLEGKERRKIESDLQKKKIFWNPYSYTKFGLLAMLKWGLTIISLFWKIIRYRVDYIHCFCTPPGIAASVLSTITRTPLVIDSYEPHAEASLENGDWSKDSFPFKFLFGFEKYMSKRAEIIISATEGMRDYAKEKYDATFDRFYVKPACVDLDLFTSANKKKQEYIDELSFENKIVCVYAGKFGGIYLDQEVFDFFKVAQDFWGDRFRVLLLTNQSDDALNEWANKSGFDMKALEKRFVMHSQVPDYLGVGDFGITPVKPIPTKRYCTPIKNGEYWALGLPVVSTANISDDSDIIENEKIGSLINEFSTNEYQKVVEEIDDLLKNNTLENLYEKIRPVAVKYRSFDISKKIYAEVYGNQN